MINESMTYVKNQTKWKAAREFCEDRKLEFKIMTEKELEYDDILQRIMNKVSGQVSEEFFRSQLLDELGSTNFETDYADTAGFAPANCIFILTHTN